MCWSGRSMCMADSSRWKCPYSNNVWYKGLAYACLHFFWFWLTALSDCAQENMTTTDTVKTGCAKLGSCCTMKSFIFLLLAVLKYYLFLVGQVVDEQAVTKWKTKTWSTRRMLRTVCEWAWWEMQSITVWLARLINHGSCIMHVATRACHSLLFVDIPCIRGNWKSREWEREIRTGFLQKAIWAEKRWLLVCKHLQGCLRGHGILVKNYRVQQWTLVTQQSILSWISIRNRYTCPHWLSIDTA